VSEIRTWEKMRGRIHGQLDRLCDAKSVGNDAINLRIGVGAADDVDNEALDWLRRAYNESA
jgi:hypothetical protein